MCACPAQDIGLLPARLHTLSIASLPHSDSCAALSRHTALTSLSLLAVMEVDHLGHLACLRALPALVDLGFRYESADQDGEASIDQLDGALLLMTVLTSLRASVGLAYFEMAAPLLGKYPLHLRLDNRYLLPSEVSALPSINQGEPMGRGDLEFYPHRLDDFLGSFMEHYTALRSLCVTVGQTQERSNQLNAIGLAVLQSCEGLQDLQLAGDIVLDVPNFAGLKCLTALRLHSMCDLKVLLPFSPSLKELHLSAARLLEFQGCPERLPHLQNLVVMNSGGDQTVDMLAGIFCGGRDVLCLRAFEMWRQEKLLCMEFWGIGALRVLASSPEAFLKCMHFTGYKRFSWLCHVPPDRRATMSWQHASKSIWQPKGFGDTDQLALVEDLFA